VVKVAIAKLVVVVNDDVVLIVGISMMEELYTAGLGNEGIDERVSSKGRSRVVELEMGAGCDEMALGSKTVTSVGIYVVLVSVLVTRVTG
jgi:hypothetical protein